MGQSDSGACFDPETIELLRMILDQAWDSLSPSRQQTVLKTDLAGRMLAAAALGERDPDRLRAIALMNPMDKPVVSQAGVILRNALVRSA